MARKIHIHKRFQKICISIKCFILFNHQSSEANNEKMNENANAKLFKQAPQWLYILIIL